MVKQLANNVIDSLRSTPMALAVIVLNTIFLIMLVFVLREIAQSIERKDAMIERSGCRPMYQAGNIAEASVVLPNRGPTLIISRR